MDTRRATGALLGDVGTASRPVHPRTDVVFIDAPYGYILPAALVPVVGLLALGLRKKEIAERYRRDDERVRHLTILGATCLLIASVSTGAYAILGTVWPAPFATVTVVIVFMIGSYTIDRRWMQA